MAFVVWRMKRTSLQLKPSRSSPQPIGGLQRDKRFCKLYGDYSQKDNASACVHNKRCNTVAMCYLVSCQKERIRHNAHRLFLVVAKRKFNHRLSSHRQPVLYTDCNVSFGRTLIGHSFYAIHRFLNSTLFSHFQLKTGISTAPFN